MEMTYREVAIEQMLLTAEEALSNAAGGLSALGG